MVVRQSKPAVHGIKAVVRGLQAQVRQITKPVRHIQAAVRGCEVEVCVIGDVRLPVSGGGLRFWIVG